MDFLSAQPPPLPWARWRPIRPRELDHEGLWLAVSAGAGVLGIAWLKAGLPLPACAFKAATGCPCLTCGATRAVLRLLHGDPAGAFLYNPLVMTALAAGVIFNLYAAAVLVLRAPRIRFRRLSPGVRRVVYAGTLAALAANWVWVIERGN